MSRKVTCLESLQRTCHFQHFFLVAKTEIEYSVDRVDVTLEMEEWVQGPHMPGRPIRPIVPFPVRHPPYPHYTVRGSLIRCSTSHLADNAATVQHNW